MYVFEKDLCFSFFLSQYNQPFLYYHNHNKHTILWRQGERFIRQPRWQLRSICCLCQWWDLSFEMSAAKVIW